MAYDRAPEDMAPLNSKSVGTGADDGEYRSDRRLLDVGNEGAAENEDAPPGGYLPVSRLRRQYLDFLASKQEEIQEQITARQYYHGAQWTADELKILRKRGQPPVTFNRLARKINSIVGMVERLRQDPKAYPRKPNNDDGAEVATQTIRSVLDGCGWQIMSAEISRHGAIDGASGIELKLVEGDHDDPDVTCAIVFADDYFYDPRSQKYDFSDARFQGVAKWVDEEEAIELFPDMEDEISSLIEYGSDLTQNSDKELKWVMVNERKVRLVEHWYVRGGVWCWCFYIGETLLAEGISPFVDKRNKTFCRFIMFSAAVDHENDRYGIVRNLKGPQDEVNQRRSKALHISNSRRLLTEKGAFDNVEEARREWSKPDGVLEHNKGFAVTPDDTQADLASQLNFLQEAKAEIESMANVTPVTEAGGAPRNMSGRALNLLQQGATAELGPFVLAYRDWKLRVYRAIWSACQTTWRAERFLRVADDGDPQGPGAKIAKFLQINGLGQDKYGRPAITNAIGTLDMDIILDEGPDVVNMMADTYDVLAGMAASGAQIPWQILIELAPIQASVKRKISAMAQQQEQTDPNAAQLQALTIQKLAAEIEKLKADALQARTNSLRHVASAAHATSEAHLNAAEIARDGMGLMSTEQAAQQAHDANEATLQRGHSASEAAAQREHDGVMQAAARAAAASQPAANA